jgi:hypothetical protein
MELSEFPQCKIKRDAYPNLQILKLRFLFFRMIFHFCQKQIKMLPTSIAADGRLITMCFVHLINSEPFKLCSEILAPTISFERSLTDFHTKVDDRREAYDRFLTPHLRKVMSCLVCNIRLSVRMTELSHRQKRRYPWRRNIARDFSQDFKKLRIACSVLWSLAPISMDPSPFMWWWRISTLLPIGLARSIWNWQRAHDERFVDWREDFRTEFILFYNYISRNS